MYQYSINVALKWKNKAESFKLHCLVMSGVRFQFLKDQDLKCLILEMESTGSPVITVMVPHLNPQSDPRNVAAAVTCYIIVI